MSKAHQHLAGMANSHESLYERILDTPGFAFHFNELALLAGEADRLRAALVAVEQERARLRERVEDMREERRQHRVELALYREMGGPDFRREVEEELDKRLATPAPAGTQEGTDGR